MAVKEQVWNIYVNDVPYKVHFSKNKVSLNNGEPIKMNKLKREGSMLETKYIMPIQEGEVALHIKQSGKTILTINGRIWDTGEEYIPSKMPGWGWVFIVLYIINFALIVGGAIGGAISAGFALLSAGIAANNKMSVVARVFACLGIWVGVTVFEIVLIFLLYGFVL